MELASRVHVTAGRFVSAADLASSLFIRKLSSQAGRSLLFRIVPEFFDQIH